MIASRHLPTLSILLALACVPTILHSYRGAPTHDGRNAAALSWRLNGIDGRPSDRSLSWVTETLGASDFIERRYGPDLTLFVARSYDAKRLYHHPELAIAHGDSYERAVVVRPAARPDIAVHTLKGAGNRFSAYALLYQGEFIEDPIRFQLRNALSLLYQPRELMTLFFVRSVTQGDAPRLDQSPAGTLLVAAIDDFLKQRRAPAP